MRVFAAGGALLGALGVVLGAFGAHALRGTLDESSLRIWHTAVEYQFWHALALFALFALALAPLPPSRWLRASAYAFSLGTVLFSGSLYALALGAPKFVGMVTPLGGIALIAGWLAAAVACLRARSD